MDIFQESRHAVKSPLDFDQMTNRYKTANGVFIFSSPDIWLIEKHLYYLLANSTVKLFQNKYKMKPDYLSFDEYGTVQLSHLLMYVNGVRKIEDFDLNEVVIPNYQAIVNMCKERPPKKDIEDLTVVNW